MITFVKGVDLDKPCIVCNESDASVRRTLCDTCFEDMVAFSETPKMRGQKAWGTSEWANTVYTTWMETKGIPVIVLNIDGFFRINDDGSTSLLPLSVSSK